MSVGGAVLVASLVGVVGFLAEGLARNLRPGIMFPDEVLSPIRWGGALSGLSLLLAGGLVRAREWGRVPAAGFALGLCLLVGADLWRDATRYWSYRDAPDIGLYGGDAITQYLQNAPRPFRVMDFSDTDFAVYPGASLMAFGVPQVLGHHAFQLDAYNALLGGRNEWGYLLASRRLWDLLAVQYVLVPAATDMGQHPSLTAWRNLAADFDTVFAGVLTASGTRAHLLERRNPAAYARLVPAAAALPDDRAIPLVADPRSSLGLDQVVLLAPDAPVSLDSLATIPPPLPNTAIVEAWEPGRMRIRLNPAPDRDAWLVVAENWYPDWHATVDGQPAPAVRGDVSLITVRVPAGGREVDLVFDSADYRTGRRISLASLVVVALALTLPPVLRRRRG